MKSKRDLNEVIDCYSKLKAGKKIPNAPLASTLLASKENDDAGLFYEGIEYQDYFLWFSSVPMMVDCLNYHIDLKPFKDKGSDSLALRYKYLHSIKNVFKTEIQLTEQEWCDKWFRGQERGGISSSRLRGLQLNEFNHDQMRHERQRVYGKDTISLRELYEVRDNPDFQLILEWTKHDPCIWLDKLLPKTHFLNENIGKWVWFINRQRGFQHFPYKLIHILRRDSEVYYHAENQLTLPDGIEVKPSEIQFITLTQARQLYETSIAAGHWSNKNQFQWGRYRKTSLWNPKDINFTADFHPDLSESTWRKFVKSDEFALIEGKKRYGKV